MPTLLEKAKLGTLLTKSASALDIPADVYEDAVLKYEEVGEWLAAEDSELGPNTPVVYPQGSFSLGTVVLPIGSCEYDIDLVCTLNQTKNQTTQKELKNRIGDRLRKHPELKEILSPSRRCWLLDYPKEPNGLGFHMDVLPSLPNLEQPPTGILLTDTELLFWQKSNPKAYVEWFRNRMRVILLEKRAALAEAQKVSIGEIPEWRIKTPLQIAIQILKRHRDIYFQADPDNRPVSMILTTLAASAYKNQRDMYDALSDIIKDMPNFISYKNGEWWVQNPVEPGENFADKWNEYPERRTNFLRWLGKVQNDFSLLSGKRSLDEAVEGLKAPLGKDVMTKVASSLGLGLKVPNALQSSYGPLADFSHLKVAPWPVVQKSYALSISATVHRKEHGKALWTLGEGIVPKKVWLRFALKTDVTPPYETHWQVVNTGNEAASSGQLRGGFYSGEDNAANVHWESTRYNGTHWVEAFIVKDGVCVARTGRTYVKVRSYL